MGDATDQHACQPSTSFQSSIFDSNRHRRRTTCGERGVVPGELRLEVGKWPAAKDARDILPCGDCCESPGFWKTISGVDWEGEDPRS